MPDTEHMIFIMEMIGTVAFAVFRRNGRDPEESGPFGNSGTGCHDRLRPGGLIRDLVIGIQPADHVPEVGLCDSGSNLRPASVRNRESFRLPWSS